MKNHTTPRTLAECTFTAGYPRAIPTRRGFIDHPISAVIFATALGVLGAVALVAWLA